MMKKTIFTILFTMIAGYMFSQTLSEQTNVVKVYPNPAKNTVNVSIENSDLKNAQISIHSIIGNKMNVEVDGIKKGLFRADIEKLPNGFYLVVVKDLETKFNKTYKFLKN